MTWEQELEQNGWERIEPGDPDYVNMNRYRKVVNGVTFLGSWSPHGTWLYEKDSGELVHGYPQGDPKEIDVEINKYLDCKKLMAT